MNKRLLLSRYAAAIWIAFGVPAVTAICFQLKYSLNYWSEWLLYVPPALAGAAGAACIWWVIRSKLWLRVAAVVGYGVVSFCLYVVIGLLVACNNGDCL